MLIDFFLYFQEASKGLSDCMSAIATTPYSPQRINNE